MISVLVRAIMKECGLKQQELADLLGVPLQRVKRLVGGDVQKLTREEGEALVKKLKVRAEYLLDGNGPMFQDETQDQFIDRMQAIKVTGAIVDALPLPEPEREGLKLCLTGDPKRDAQAIAQGAGYSTAHESTVLTTGDGATVYRLESPAATPAAQPAAEWLQVLELTLDELNSAGRRLPGAKVIQLVDLLMQLQQAGARLEPELLRSQLRLIA